MMNARQVLKRTQPSNHPHACSLILEGSKFYSGVTKFHISNWYLISQQCFSIKRYFYLIKWLTDSIFLCTYI